MHCDCLLPQDFGHHYVLSRVALLISAPPAPLPRPVTRAACPPVCPAARSARPQPGGPWPPCTRRTGCSCWAPPSCRSSTCGPGCRCRLGRIPLCLRRRTRTALRPVAAARAWVAPGPPPPRRHPLGVGVFLQPCWHKGWRGPLLLHHGPAGSGGRRSRLSVAGTPADPPLRGQRWDQRSAGAVAHTRS